MSVLFRPQVRSQFERMRRQKGLGHRLKQVWKWFDEFNTIGGLSPALHGSNKVSRFFWAILFVLGTTLTVWGVVETVQDFLKFGTKTSVSYEYPRSLVMPSVTVCNANRVHCRNLYDYINVKEKVLLRFMWICYSLTFEFSKENQATETLCKLFILSQCSISLTETDMLLHDKRVWTDVCLEYVHPPPNSTEDPLS